MGAEANVDVERVVNQVFSFVDKERNRLGTDALRGLLTTKNYLQTIGSCLDFQIDDSMMASIKSSHRKYIARTKSDKNDESCVHKRFLEDAKKEFEENKRLRSIEARRSNKIKSNESKVTFRTSTFINGGLRENINISRKRKERFRQVRKTSSAIYYQINLSTNC